MSEPLSNLDKVKFLVDELLRQSELYNLTTLMIVSDPQVDMYRTGARGDPSSVLMRLGELLVETGKALKPKIPNCEQLFGEMMRLSWEIIKEEEKE